MSNHRGNTHLTGVRAIIAGAVAATALGATAIAITNSGVGQASQSPDAHAGAHAAGAAPEAASAVGNIGPLTETDKTFLVKVRQAGLWEIPAGRLAQTHASSEAVKRAGLHVLDGHSLLDQLVREDAAITGVQLPDQATAEQQNWDRQLSEAQGLQFDQLFVSLLRSSHGKIFATIAEVRAGTHNDLVRRLARQANQTVMDHMEVLEDTGLVSEQTLDEVGAAVAPRPAK
jgi:predicted outer membrane protein